ncbi:MAG: carboxypeptidase regulatory-like domain-containing protein, partial [Acidobacteriaceae bacterium]|nr:carboxypeptidase regulatory-like domain-containing protein [Acidobacteriaceae bacterium]
SQAAAINGTWELPLGQGHAIFNDVSSVGQQFAAGWSLSGIATIQSGFPFSPQLGYNPTGNGDTRNPVRPSLSPDFRGPLYLKTASQWFNAAAFTAPYPGTFGNAGRDSLSGPGLADLDLSIGKITTIHERLRAQFRAEYFNILNRANFNTPNPVVLSTGPTPSKPTASAAISPTAGVITATSTTSRQLQFGIKFLF